MLAYVCTMCAAHVILRFNSQIDSINSFFNGSNWRFFCRLHKHYNRIARIVIFLNSFFLLLIDSIICFLLRVPRRQYIHLEPVIPRQIKAITYTHSSICSHQYCGSLIRATILLFIPFKFKFNLIFDAFTHITSLLKIAARKIAEKENTNSSNWILPVWVEIGLQTNAN